jgi:hypothetical protein
MIEAYNQALAQQHNKAQEKGTVDVEGNVNNTNDRCKDLRDAYSALKGEFSEVWLSENRPYWLDNVTVRYDLAIQMWQQRSDLLQGGGHDWRDGKGLHLPSALGMPVAPATK